MISRTKRLFLIPLSILAFLIISLVPIHAQGGGGGGGGGGGRNGTNYTAYFDPEIEEEFDVKDHVVIIVDLFYPNMSKVDEILANLSPEEFNLSVNGKLLGGFGFHGNATEPGFDKLVHNPDVRAIYWGGWNSFIQENITRELEEENSGEEKEFKILNPILLAIIIAILIITILIYLRIRKR